MTRSSSRELAPPAPLGGHQRGRAQPGDCQRPVNEKGGDRLLRLDRWQKQQIDPAEGAGDHSRDGAVVGSHQAGPSGSRGASAPILPTPFAGLRSA